HDHASHAEYKCDPRFVLHRRAEHGACPEIVTPVVVERAGPIDTRLGTPSKRAVLLDRALRGNPRDDGLRGLMIRFLVDGAEDPGMLARFATAAESVIARERESSKLATRYEVRGNVAVCDATRRDGAYEKTHLLLLGQELATISLVHDETTVTVAARFDSGIDLLGLLGLEGGMPTRVSVNKKELPRVLKALGAA
ncbi:MAG: hypothetical protein AAF645_25390, partial [Myxococcota bacterium]